MSINLHANITSVNISLCTSIENIQVAACQDADLQKLKPCAIQDGSHKYDKVEQSMQSSWTVRLEPAVINDTVMKGKAIVIPFLLHWKILKKSCSNHIDMEKKRLLPRESVY